MIIFLEYDSFSDEPWIIELKNFIITNFKESDQFKKTCLIGICFGHQIIARSFEMKVQENPNGWEVGYTELSIVDTNKIFFKRNIHPLIINSLHKDYINPETFVDKNFTLLVKDKHTKIQMMCKDNILSFQGHPELSGKFLRDLTLLRYASGIFSDQIFNHVNDAFQKCTSSIEIGILLFEFIIKNSI